MQATSSPLFLLGLSRTGSTSVEKALKNLGYKNVYSMDRLAKDHANDCTTWLRALEVKYGSGNINIQKEEWEQLLDGFDVVRGLPAAAFAPELIAAFPNSKVILSTRNVDSWYSSCLQTIRWRVKDPVLRWLSRVDWQSSNQYQALFSSVQDSLYEGNFEKNGKRVFTEHNERVRTLVRRDLLLEYHVQQGWGPLCSFLEKDVPNTEFPRGNDPEAFKKSARQRDRAVLRRVLAHMALLGAGALVLVKVARWLLM